MWKTTSIVTKLGNVKRGIFTLLRHDNHNSDGETRIKTKDLLTVEKG